MALALPVHPGDGNNDAVASLLDPVNARVVAALGLSPLAYRCENLTGLLRAVSGRRRAPEPSQAAPSTPLHLRVDQRDKRLDIAGDPGLVSSADHVDAHTSRVLLPAVLQQAKGLASHSPRRRQARYLRMRRG